MADGGYNPAHGLYTGEEDKRRDGKPIYVCAKDNRHAIRFSKRSDCWKLIGGYSTVPYHCYTSKTAELPSEWTDFGEELDEAYAPAPTFTEVKYGRRRLTGYGHDHGHDATKRH